MLSVLDRFVMEVIVPLCGGQASYPRKDDDERVSKKEGIRESITKVFDVDNKDAKNLRLRRSKINEL